MFKASGDIFKEHKFYIVVMIGLLVLPSIYAVVFPEFAMESVSKVSDLPVVVVNTRTRRLQWITSVIEKIGSGEESDSMNLRFEGQWHFEYYEIAIQKDFFEECHEAALNRPRKWCCIAGIEFGARAPCGKAG